MKAEFDIGRLDILALTAGNGENCAIGHGEAVIRRLGDFMEIYQDALAGAVDKAAGCQQLFHDGVVGAYAVAFCAF